MSTFNGEIKEIPGVSVDHFDNKSLKCYFLSHCHSDHMSGLSSLQTDSPVYTTAISALFIQQKCPQLSENLIILEPGIPTSIRLTQNCETFVVTALSAGHCAGSCMLLFQKENCDILYTGDFRISLKNAKNIKIFEDIRDSTIYLDSTFLSTKFPQFPSQAESVKEILEIVQNFLTKSTHHKGKIFSNSRCHNLTSNLMKLNFSSSESTSSLWVRVSSDVFELKVERENSHSRPGSLRAIFINISVGLLRYIE